MQGVAKQSAGKKFARTGLAVAAAGLFLVSGCGNQYRPVVSAINPVGPAGQPTKYAGAVSNPGNGLPGLLTVVDVSGDTVLATPSIQSNPTYFMINNGGSSGYSLNAAGSFDSFGLGNPPALITSSIGQTTLSQGADSSSVSTFTLVGSAGTIFVSETGLGKIAALQNGNAVSLIQELAVGANPVYVVGIDGTTRAYAISQGTTGAGTVYSIEGQPLSVSSSIPVGNMPVYGVMTPDAKRAFIVNKGSGTVSVINVVNNAPDATTPVIPATGTLGINPVWADLSPRTASVAGTNELVVLNAGNGTAAGSLSIISIPLCSPAAQPTNPNCNATNPVDATGFGTVLATVPVGINPTMVSILQDGTKAYVVNEGRLPGTNSPTDPGVDGSLSVVNLISGTVTATIPAVSSAAQTVDVNTTPTAVYGHPNTVSATIGTPTGKVYITSSDNKFLTVIRTDTDTIQTHISLQGLGMPLPVAPPAGASVPVRPQSPGVLVTLP
ncbi:MAG TPA: YncE family protein [Acidobacteriaceae bacterium]